MKGILFSLLLISTFYAEAQINFKPFIHSGFNQTFTSDCYYPFVCRDFNKDNILDFAKSSYQDSALVIYLGDANGNFVFHQKISNQIVEPVNACGSFLACDDLNKDGMLDLAAITDWSASGPDSVEIYMGDGLGNFSLYNKFFLGYDAGAYPISILDINNDGSLDILGRTWFDNSLEVVYGDGLGNFSSGTSKLFSIPSQQRGEIHVIDVNNDQHQDLILTHDYSISILSDTNYNFKLDTTLLTQQQNNYIALADFNNDGYTDFSCLSSDASNSEISMFINSKNGNFHLKNSYILGVPDAKIISADFDGDGTIDIGYSHNGTNGDSVTILRGDGSGNLLLSDDFTFAINSYSKYKNIMLASDVNKDSKIDIVSIGPNSLGTSDGINVLINVSQSQPINIQPNVSGTCGFTSINFFGSAIKPKMHLKFTAIGQSDIEVPDSNITYKTPNNFTAIGDFSGATIGKYNVVLTDSNGIATTITDGFELQTTSLLNLEIKIVGPSQTRIGLPTRYYLKITNNNNCPVIGVPIALYITGNNIVQFRDSIFDLSGNRQDLLTYADVSQFYEPPGQNKGYNFAISGINANSVLYFPIEILSLSPHELCNIRASVGSALIDVNQFHYKKTRSCNVFPINPKARTCSEKLSNLKWQVGQNFLDMAVGCGISTYCMTDHQKFLDMGTLSIYDVKSEADATFVSCVTFLGGIAALALSAPIGVAVAGGVAFGYAEYVSASSVGEFYGECNCFFNCDNSSNDFEGRSAHDPNDKYGIGYGSEHWINNTEILSYGVHFENVDSASASAQTVRVIDTLDVNKLDVKTFKLDLLTVGKNTIDFSTRTSVNQPIFYDMRPANPVILKIETFLDSLTGRLEMLYTTLDTLTYLPTTDPLAGFLPPNVNKPEGEGAFYYSIKLKPNLPNNDIIKNTAHIYFDFNDPIVTPTWINTIDILAPTSKMNFLAKSTNDTTIYLSWQGNDAQSGVQKYDVMYSENGGAFLPYVSNFANDSVRFFGKAGSTYSFYTITVDNVGNREVKTNGEITISINQKDIIVYPNPSKGTFNVQIKNDEEVKKVSLFDPLGKEVAIEYTKSNNVFKVNVPVLQHLQNYILRVQTDKNCYTSKLLIEK